MQIFIVVTVIAAIIAALYCYVFFRYIKSKLQGAADDACSGTHGAVIDHSARDEIEVLGLFSESDIINLESLIHKKLPEFYASFLMNYPEDLVALGAPYNTVSELSLPNTRARIVALNALEFVPAGILVVGEDGLGNLYYNILSDSNSVIYLSNHEAPQYLAGGEGEIDWHASWDLKFHDLDEMISFLKESFSERDASR